MRITSSFPNATAGHPAINQEKSVGKGGIYSFSVPAAGVWGFYNLDDVKDLSGSCMSA